MNDLYSCTTSFPSKVYRSAGSSGKTIVTIAIGKECLRDWEENALWNWLNYCIQWDLGLVCIVSDLVDDSSTIWKKPTWQKLLIPRHLRDFYPNIKRICYLDTDVLISPMAPDIFEVVQQGKIGLVSLYDSLPYDRQDTLDRVAYFRNLTSAGVYPLDSALFITLDDIYRYHNLTPKENLACMGLIVFDMCNPKIHLFEEYFKIYRRDVTSITNGGDQTHLNFHILSDFEVSWLDYKWQAIWVYEAANKYPAAFWTENYSNYLQDIASSLASNYFLHFAGSWPESQIWKKAKSLQKNPIFCSLPGFLSSKKLVKTGKPKGQIKFPSSSILRSDGSEKQ